MYGHIQAMGVADAIFETVENTDNQKKGELLESFVLVPGLVMLTYSEYHPYILVFTIIIATNSPVRMNLIFYDRRRQRTSDGQIEPIT